MLRPAVFATMNLSSLPTPSSAYGSVPPLIKSSSSTAAPTQQKRRKKRRELNFADRIEVITGRNAGKSMRQLAAEFGCGKTQILNILVRREVYLREWEEKASGNPHFKSRKRLSRRTGNEETNRLVWEWYCAQKESGVRVTGPALQKEALSIAKKLGISNFAASNGWLESFRRVHNVGLKPRHNTNGATTANRKLFLNVPNSHESAMNGSSGDGISSSSDHNASSNMDSLNQDASMPSLEYFPSGDHADSPSPVLLQVYSILNDGQNDKINNQQELAAREGNYFQSANPNAKQQQRKSVLVSTRSVIAAAAAILVASDGEEISVSEEDGSFSSPIDLSIKTSPLTSNDQTRRNSDPFGSLTQMASSQWLSSFLYSDNRGEDWMEIQPPPAAVIRTPLHGYRTLSMRLIVNSHLDYWLEALGQCVCSGSFRSTSRGGLDFSVAQTVFNILASYCA